MGEILSNLQNYRQTIKIQRTAGIVFRVASEERSFYHLESSTTLQDLSTFILLEYMIAKLRLLWKVQYPKSEPRGILSFKYK